MKKYSLPYWCKQKLRYLSQPEPFIQKAVELFAATPEQSDIAFDGSPLQLINAIYLEWRKGMGVHWGLFPTPLEVADELAAMLEVSEKDIVFDPGCGFGNLLHAARQRGAKAFGCEFQHWIPPFAPTLKLDIARGDYLDGYTPGEFTCVLTNPPYGKGQEQSDLIQAFLQKLASQTPAGTRIGAVLPRGYVESQTPIARFETMKQFSIVRTIALPEATFRPLTTVQTEMVHLLRNEVNPRPAPVQTPEPPQIYSFFSDYETC